MKGLTRKVFGKWVEIFYLYWSGKVSGRNQEMWSKGQWRSLNGFFYKLGYLKWLRKFLFSCLRKSYSLKLFFEVLKIHSCSFLQFFLSKIEAIQWSIQSFLNIFPFYPKTMFIKPYIHSALLTLQVIASVCVWELHILLHIWTNFSRINHTIFTWSPLLWAASSIFHISLLVFICLLSACKNFVMHSEVDKSENLYVFFYHNHNTYTKWQY